MEIEKVAVLPVPDWACAMTSRPVTTGTIARCWMAEGRSNLVWKIRPVVRMSMLLRHAMLTHMRKFLAVILLSSPCYQSWSKKYSTPCSEITRNLQPTCLQPDPSWTRSRFRGHPEILLCCTGDGKQDRVTWWKGKLFDIRWHEWFSVCKFPRIELLSIIPWNKGKLLKSWS